MTLGVVIPCYRQERLLPRTLAALESALSGRDWRGAIVLAAPGRDTEVPEARSERWTLVRPLAGSPGAPALTPGAARNAGLAAVPGAWVLFVDADVEVERAWLDRALSEWANDDDAGAWGRIEEWFVDAHGERPGVRDLYRVGDADAAAAYVATLALYRRSALERVGGYDGRLHSEEDFELGLRLRRAGLRLHTLSPLAAKHWSAPRPSFGEIGRRWRTGLCFGPGEALRLSLGRGTTAALARRNAHYLVVIAYALLAPVVIARGPTLALAWCAAPIALLGLMTVRKRSARLAAHSILTWVVMSAGLVAGFVRGGARAPAPVAREAAC